MLTLNSTVSVARDVVSCDLVEEAALLNLNDGVYYGLNPVGARIWNLLQKPIVVKDILKTLLDEYEVDEDVAEGDLMGLLEELREKELVKVE